MDITKPHDEISRTECAINQRVHVQGTAKQIYEALTESKKFDAMSEFSAAFQGPMAMKTPQSAISGEVGGKFSLFAGQIEGRHLELLPHQLIVQAWRVSAWDAGEYSIATFKLVPVAGGTNILFKHTGFPKEHAEQLAAGWQANYWKPLAEFLSRH